MNLKFLIVLVNYNNWVDTSECVDSLKNAGIEISNILIIENDSENDSFFQLQRLFPDIKILKQNQNKGFSGGNNIGISYALHHHFEYVILLNNDTLIEKDAISVLIEKMDIHKEATLGTGQIRYYPDKNKIWYAGGKLIRWRGLAIHNFENKYADEINHYKDEYVTFASGCYLCIRISDIDILGLLDEKFFLYLEDIEYSARAVRLKLKILYIPSSVIYHKCRGERQLKEQTLYYAVRNRNLLIEKSFPKIARIYFLIVINLKMIFWFFKNRKLYNAAKMGVLNYKEGIFGEINLDLLNG
ncbi:MAG: glycosyltransferase family 2 protein [Ignavibacteria bacterium]|nr:glycosyltransferase family 2 protein [Ignavibacteria bacterium]